MRLTMLVMGLALLLAGCGRGSSYLADRPLVKLPDKVEANQQQRAEKAFMRALQRFGWQIRELERSDVIVAEACRRGQHCVEIEATIEDNGTVSIRRTPGQDLTDNEASMLRGWMNHLQREYRRNMQRLP